MDGSPLFNLADHLVWVLPQAQQMEASLQSHHQLAFLVAQAWSHTCKKGSHVWDHLERLTQYEKHLASCIT